MEMKAAYADVSRRHISQRGLAFSTLSLESVEDVMKVIANITQNVRGGVDFYDIGSGLGNIVMAAENLPNVVNSVGIEIDEDLHTAALDLKKKLGSNVELLNADAMSEQLVISNERAVVIFAFDLVYTDELIESIFYRFVDFEGFRVLVTTKNLQGIGAAIRRGTLELIENTEDALCLIDDCGVDGRKLRKASEKVYKGRETSLRSASQRSDLTIKGGIEIEVTFGENTFLNRNDAVCIKSPQYECCDSAIGTLYLEQKVQNQEDLQASPGVILEKAKMRFYWIESC